MQHLMVEPTRNVFVESWPPNIRSAWAMGRNAFLRGWVECPFLSERREARAWLCGWNDEAAAFASNFDCTLDDIV